MKQTIMRMRRIIDLLMTLTLFFLMGYQLWGEAAHEWVGTVMGVLFLLHQWYNRRWYCTLTQGPWSLVRTFHMLVNLLSVLAMLALLASGVVLSSHVFDFVVLSDFIGTAQRVHLAASHWLYVLLALHIGLHGQLLAGAFKRKAHALHGAAFGRCGICTLWPDGFCGTGLFGCNVFARTLLFGGCVRIGPCFLC